MRELLAIGLKYKQKADRTMSYPYKRRNGLKPFTTTFFTKPVGDADLRPISKQGEIGSCLRGMRCGKEWEERLVDTQSSWVWQDKSWLFLFGQVTTCPYENHAKRKRNGLKPFPTTLCTIPVGDADLRPWKASKNGLSPKVMRKQMSNTRKFPPTREWGECWNEGVISNIINDVPTSIFLSVPAISWPLRETNES